MTFLRKQERHNLNEFCCVKEGALLGPFMKRSSGSNTGSQIKGQKLKRRKGQRPIHDGVLLQSQSVSANSYLSNCLQLHLR